MADLDGDMSAMCINYSFLYIYSYLGLFNLPYTIPIKKYLLQTTKTTSRSHYGGIRGVLRLGGLRMDRPLSVCG